MSSEKLALVIGCLATAPACGGATFGPAPEISELAFDPLVPSDTTRLVGTVHVQDSLGLTALMVEITVVGPESTEALPPRAVDSPVVGQVEATIPLRISAKRDFATGSYQIVVTLTEDGVPSNALASDFMVQ